MNEFMYCFQISKLIIFEVNYYTLNTNKTPYFSTSANRFIKSKRDYAECGQVQEYLLPKGSQARKFYDKWCCLHLRNLSKEEYKEIISDIEELKAQYNYIESKSSCFREKQDGIKIHIPFYEVVELSKIKLKINEE